MVQGVGEDPEGAGGWRHLGPLLDNLGWNPDETGNLQKNLGSGSKGWLLSIQQTLLPRTQT